MSETVMTTEATTPTEGQAASQPVAAPATAAEQGSVQQSAVEGQSTESQAAEGAKPDNGKEAPQGAPETYAFVAPEGNEFDEGVIAEYSAVAKELNLSQEAAQKMLDRLAPAMQNKQAERMETIRNEWADNAKADKEFGGVKLTENMAVAKKALDQFGTPELRTLLNESGLGNHPEIIRAFYRAGKAISQDGFVGGKEAPAKGNNAASVLYPNQK